MIPVTVNGEVTVWVPSPHAQEALMALTMDDNTAYVLITLLVCATIMFKSYFD